jgi:asparagine synthase (glutamine-hydrolysing)
MCGIVGILNLTKREPVDEKTLLNMLSIIRHRGPDESGIYIDPKIGLGHNRLSIIGLENGIQPISNEDETLWIIYNGEAFNYIELKEELIKKGHIFKTKTDTEVILHLFEEYGPDSLNRLNGQFAFAIWNSQTQELFLARDRVGIRPLYYCQVHGKLIFASEIKAIFLHPEVSREIDPKALYQVFTCWTTLTPRTVFKGVRELSPGHYMVVRGCEIQTSQYWSIPFGAQHTPFKGTLEDAIDELNNLLKDAIRLRLRADVPVGSYLSGGLDSSTITAFIARYFNNRLKTFSMAFANEQFDETPYQDELINHLKTNHRREYITSDKIRDNFPETIRHCEIPLLRTAPVPLFLLSNLVRENQFKVVLTGEGADEVFGGYNIFKEAKVRRFWAKYPQSRLRPLLLMRIYPYVFKDAARTRFFLQKFYSVKKEDLDDLFLSHRIRWSNSKKNAIFFNNDIKNEITDYDPVHDLEKRLPPDFSRWDGLSRAQYLETSVFLSNYLLSSQGDRVAMANSVEMRLPFLDYRVLDFASRLPSKWKIKGLNEKYILKQVSKKLVTESITNRPKQPYRAPIREVFFSGQDQNNYVSDMLSESCLKRAGYFDAGKVDRLVKRFTNDANNSGGEVRDMALVGILSTQLLHHQFIESRPSFSANNITPGKVVKRNLL